MTTVDVVDPKGLIRESYRIEGITESECRSIFLDWAINMGVDVEPSEHIRAALTIYAKDAPDGHPMTKVLNEGLAPKPKARRRGGRGARLGY
jgi:hypothetical protein